jgi:hypothetical protein
MVIGFMVGRFVVGAPATLADALRILHRHRNHLKPATVTDAANCASRGMIKRPSLATTIIMT